MSPRPATAADPHRQGLRRSPAPRTPRRVSGPTRPPSRAQAHAPARPHTAAYGDGAIALPRIPAPRVGVPRLARRLLRRLAELPDHRFLDRLLTGRAWIALVGFALIGIVFMQVSLLKLNAGIGRAVEQQSVLERENAMLRADVSRLGSNDRIQSEAEALGMVLPPPGSVRFLGRDGQAVGGDAVTSMAVGTPTSASPANSAYGATAATPSSVARAATTTGIAPATTATGPSAPASSVASTSPLQSPASSPQVSAPATSTTGSTTPTPASPSPTSSQVAPVDGGTTAP